MWEQRARGYRTWSWGNTGVTTLHLAATGGGWKGTPILFFWTGREWQGHQNPTLCTGTPLLEIFCARIDQTAVSVLKNDNVEGA